MVVVVVVLVLQQFYDGGLLCTHVTARLTSKSTNNATPLVPLLSLFNDDLPGYQTITPRS